MSEEQLSALLAKLTEDAGLREKLQGAGDLDAFVAVAKDNGFDVSKADLLKYQANQTVELSDEELENVSGGFTVIWAGMGLVDGMVAFLTTGLVERDGPESALEAWQNRS